MESSSTKRSSASAGAAGTCSRSMSRRSVKRLASAHGEYEIGGFVMERIRDMVRSAASGEAHASSFIVGMPRTRKICASCPWRSWRSACMPSSVSSTLARSTDCIDVPPGKSGAGPARQRKPSLRAFCGGSAASRSSLKMHPTDQRSSLASYGSSISTSGARYHRVTTCGVSCRLILGIGGESSSAGESSDAVFVVALLERWLSAVSNGLSCSTPAFSMRYCSRASSVSTVGPTARASPKSHSRSSPVSVMRMLPGLRSRWMAPSAWMCSRPRRIMCMYERTCTASILRGPLRCIAPTRSVSM
mmetsp:Transcript_56991/g.169427  ORF Transcript_56991/g.169427 Transcript_56991/m.169427 type:complete len:303 (+) Transcript_56991:1140-2048(+)